MGKKQKYYVVWKGVSPGIYTSWTDCQLQVKGYDGAQYKSFDTQEEAEHALASPAHHYIGNHKSDITHHTSKKQSPRYCFRPYATFLMVVSLGADFYNNE